MWFRGVASDVCNSIEGCGSRFQCHFPEQWVVAVKFWDVVFEVHIVLCGVKRVRSVAGRNLGVMPELIDCVFIVNESLSPFVACCALQVGNLCGESGENVRMQRSMRQMR